MDETIKGLIADLGRTYAPDDPVRSRDLNRWQADLARLSWALQKLGVDLHYPHVATSDNEFDATASADKVTLDTGVKFVLAGVPFDTSDLDLADREFTIPDDSTRFLRVELAIDCGAVVLDDPADATNKNWTVTRDLKLSFTLVTGTEGDAEGTGGGPSSPESMRILKAVKAGAGTSPTVTLYENKGHSHVATDLSDYYTQAEVDSLLTGKAEITYITKQTLVNAGSATTNTTVDASAYIGANAKEVYLDCIRTGTTPFCLFLTVPGGVEREIQPHESSAGYKVQAVIGVDSNGEFQYRIDNSGGQITLKLVGWA